MKVKFGMSNDEIKQLQMIQWQPQVISIPVSKEAIKEFNVTDTSVIKNGDITFTMNNTLQFGDVKAIRIQDQVVLDIVKNNLWDRPIYFASTCSQDCFIGMDNYLDMEGLASRLVPEKLIGANDVNANITYKDLFDINPSYSKTYLPGFKFRGVNDKRVFFDETETRLIQNYRNVYVRLAYYYLNVAKNDSLCIATLDQMDKIIPKSNIDIDYRFLYDIGNLYYAAGDTSKYKLIAADVEKQALQNLDVSANDLQSPYNAYSILERIYVNLKEYDKAIGILQRLETYYPNAGGIKTEIQQLQQMKQANAALKK
jgi:tetratricopeptide (TPR) repeat protein